MGNRAGTIKKRDNHLEKALSQIPLPMALINNKYRMIFVNDSLISLIGTNVVNRQLKDVFSIDSAGKSEFLIKPTVDIATGTLNGKEKANICISAPISENGNRIVTICCPSVPCGSEELGSADSVKFTCNKVGLVAYHIGKYGPQPFYVDKMDFLENIEETLLKMGVFSITAIGQGHDHVKGLFGPLPVPGNDKFLTTIYTFSVNDKNIEDPRAKGKRYIMLTIIFPVFFEDVINDRIRLRKILRNELQNVNDYASLTPDFFDSMKSKILDYDIRIDPRTRSLERKLSALYKLSSDLLRSPENSLDFVMDYAEKVLDFKFFGILSLHRDRNSLEAEATIGYDKDLSKEILDLDMKSIITACANEKRIINVPDVSESDIYLEMDEIIKSELAVPVMINDRVIGVLNAESEQLGAFNEDDAVLMQNLSERVALVFRQNLLEEKLKAIHGLISELFTEKDLEGVFQNILRFADSVLDFKIFSVVLLNEKTNLYEFVAHHGYPEEFDLSNLKFSITDEVSIIVKVAREGKTVNIGNVREVDFFYGGYDPEIMSELAVPLKNPNGVVIGVLNAEAPQKNAFTKEDEEFMETLAGYLAIILELFTLRNSKEGC